jgi:hypothetical protein
LSFGHPAPQIMFVTIAGFFFPESHRLLSR